MIKKSELRRNALPKCVTNSQKYLVTHLKGQILSILKPKKFKKMAKNLVSAVFDRKKMSAQKGKGTIEIRISFSRDSRKYIKVGECSPEEWDVVSKSSIILEKIDGYLAILQSMSAVNEDITIENFNRHIGVVVKQSQSRVQENSNFLDWLLDAINKQNLRPNTVRQKMVTYNALRSFGKIKKFKDLTPQNIYAWDEWLREDGTRTDVSVFNYHRRLHPYIIQAFQKGIIDFDPYKRCHFNRGRSKERKPLTEPELKKVRELKLPPKIAKVRDLFIFAAYTGLAYCDVMEFDFHTMTEEHDGMYYIDGERVKTGSTFFTPILPPAMEVLQKYNYDLPKISNQKANDYLHVIESRVELKKTMTFHVARHSFATLALSHNVPIDKVARMLGHQDIKTTQIYAKILKKSVEDQCTKLANDLL